MINSLILLEKTAPVSGTESASRVLPIFVRLFSSSFMPGRRPAASASSPPIRARRAGAAADLRAAAHLSEMRAGPEAAHQPGPVHLLTAAHPREPERAAAAGRTQRGTASHRRRGAAPRCQEQRAAGGSVQVEDERRTGEPVTRGDPPSGSEVRGREPAQPGGKEEEEEEVSCVATGRMLRMLGSRCPLLVTRRVCTAPSAASASPRTRAPVSQSRGRRNPAPRSCHSNIP